MDIVADNEKVFQNFPSLAQKLQMLIIDEMQPADRVRFTRCSKLSNKEAKSSKNYIYGFEMITCHEDRIYILVIYDKSQEFGVLQGYEIEFRSTNGAKYMKWSRFEGENEFRRRKLEYYHLDLLQFAAEYFQLLLEPYQKTIKYLKFYGCSFMDRLKDYTFGIESLDNLQTLYINGKMDYEYIFSKLGKPLKNLSVGRGEYNQGLLEHPEIYRVQNSIYMGSMNFNNAQMLRLAARKVNIPIGNLTEKEIFMFIRSWQNGTIGKKIRTYEWILNGSGFDKNRLLRLLRIRDYDVESTQLTFDIQHFKEVEKTAKLEYFDVRSRQSIIFKV